MWVGFLAFWLLLWWWLRWAVHVAVLLLVLAAGLWGIKTAAWLMFPEDEIIAGRACTMRDGRTGEFVRSGFFRWEYCRAERK